MNPQATEPSFTFHAPPERLPLERVREQSASLGNVTALLDCMPDFAMILNQQRQIVFANRALRDFAGNSVGGQLIGLRPGELLDCREARCAPSGCGTGKACRTCGFVNALLGALAGRSVVNECRIATTTADVFDLRVSASPFRWLTGDYALVIVTNIGNERRREMLEQIFFRDILNTAGNIQGMTELIRTDPACMEVFQKDLYETAETLVNEIRRQSLLLVTKHHERTVPLGTESPCKPPETDAPPTP